MNHKNLPRVIGLALAALLLVACGAHQPAAVQRVKAYYEAINAIEPAEETRDGNLNLSEGIAALHVINEEHTTTTGVDMNFFTIALASGMVSFTNMEYELVSESAECAVVRASGEMAIGEEADAFEEEYVVVKRGEKWLIDLSPRAACE